MPDCPQSTSNCSDPAPIGGAAIGSACDPCSILKPEDMFEQFKTLQEKVCALETKYSNWHQLLGRTRNRVTSLEDLVKNLPEDENEISAVGCGGLETTSEADAVIVCDEGAEKTFVPSGVPEQIVFCEGKVKKVPKALGWYPLSVKQLVLNQSNMAPNNAVVVLPSYPASPCGEVWALFECTGQAFPGPSSSGTNVRLDMNGYVLISTGFFGDFVSGQAMARVTNASSTFNVNTSGSGVRGVTATLIGYYY